MVENLPAAGFLEVLEFHSYLMEGNKAGKILLYIILYVHIYGKYISNIDMVGIPREYINDTFPLLP